MDLGEITLTVGSHSWHWEGWPAMGVATAFLLVCLALAYAISPLPWWWGEVSGGRQR